MTRLLRLEQVTVAPTQLSRFSKVLDASEMADLEEFARRARGVLRGCVVWSVNSTAHGGGVAEMMQTLVAYTRGAGVDARWLVIRGTPDFYAVTKRLHNHLHGSAGDGGALDDEARAIYDRTTEANGARLRALVRPGDVVLLHDPQTAGLVDVVRETGAKVVWRCHIGVDDPNDHVRGAWNFLRPYVDLADAYVWSRPEHVWEGIDPARVAIIPPSIDAFSPKNEALPRANVTGILRAAGILAGDRRGATGFTRADGTPGRVDRTAVMVEESRLELEDRAVLQVSRFDRLKDPVGVLRGFAARAGGDLDDAHLVLAGPVADAVADDPEAAEVWDELGEAWRALEPTARARVHLAALPMVDIDENAAIVNALQRHAEVVVQKSLQEGFGLTVAEAMWKARPVIASRVGGIQDQIVDGVSGILLDDPTDLAALGDALQHLLKSPQLAAEMGAEAQRRVRDHFLGPRHLRQYLDLVQVLIEPQAAARLG